VETRLEGVTVNEVRVAPDGSYARVFWVTLGQPASAAEAIEKAKPYLRRCLAAELRVRRVPELDFRMDEAAARAERVEDVLRELEQARAEKQKEGPA
jgi:ribosome-binding factor A